MITLSKPAADRNADPRRADPRKVGGRYFCGYWQQEYTVLAIETGQVGNYRWPVITVLWSRDGHKTTHRTAWDHKIDRVLSEPLVEEVAAL